ncbi:cell wall protein [Streptomyces cinereoruber]|uniref:cell wall protein n=1 Tax=Streptomyces cinereoruber TaxID=67260 RepID=UPI0036340F05
MSWLIGAGLHRGANQTTQQVADDLADRMDYTTGHVRYCLDEMVARTGISRPTIKRHVAVLRELGALAWVVHGTRANIRRALGGRGYAGTATVYAATIPPVYDHAMGHRIIGTGYTSRVLPQRPTLPVDNRPVENAGQEGCEPPSLVVVSDEGQVQMMGGVNYTRGRASRNTPPSPSTHNSSSNSGGIRRRTPAQVAHEIQETRLVRALVNWTQGERRLRRLAHVLRPLFDRGLTAHQIADELTGMCLGWRPKNPAAYIHATLVRDAAHQETLDTEPVGAYTEDGDWAAPHFNRLPTPQHAGTNDDALTEDDIPLDVTAADLEDMRLQGQHNPELVQAWIATAGEDSAREVYGPEAVRLALLDASSTLRFNPWMDATYA